MKYFTWKTNANLTIFPGRVPGYDQVWFFGDSFGMNTFTKYYHQTPLSEFGGYVQSNLEVTGFMNNKHRSLDTSTIGRLRNLLVGALCDHPLPLKIIVIVPDDDIIRYIYQNSVAVAESTDGLDRILSWMMREYYRILVVHKENLPGKSKKAHYPFIVWIAAPLHVDFGPVENELRAHFNKHLLEVSKMFSDVAVLKLGLRRHISVFEGNKLIHSTQYRNVLGGSRQNHTVCGHHNNSKDFVQGTYHW